MASMPHNITEMDSQSSPNYHETTATNDDGEAMDTSTAHPTGSSLAMAAAKTRSDDTSESSTLASEELQMQEEAFKPVPTTPKRSNMTSSNTETTDESIAMMETSTEDHATTDTEMSPVTEPPFARRSMRQTLPRRKQTRQKLPANASVSNRSTRSLHAMLPTPSSKSTHLVHLPLLVTGVSTNSD